MSIATDEAEQWAQSRYFGSVHTERHDGRAVSVPDYPQKTNLRREGYIAGRTAEPTEAEIEAAARVFFENLHYPSASLDWNNASDHVKDNWRLKTRLALTAARKAVTGDERASDAK